ncbi:MMPL family transporter [bacterium]|nr:MMPL family transporter [bacterium]
MACGQDKPAIRERFYAGMGNALRRFYWLALLLGFGLTLASIRLSGRLSVDMTWLGMAPEKSEAVKTYKIMDEAFDGVNPILVVLSGDESEVLKKAADELASDYLKLNGPSHRSPPGPLNIPEATAVDSNRLIKDVVVRLDRNFLERYGLWMQGTRTLEDLGNLAGDLSLNGIFSYLNRQFQSGFTVGRKGSAANPEKQALRMLHLLERLLQSVKGFLDDPSAGREKLQADMDDFLLGEAYFISYESKMLMIFVYPVPSAMEVFESVPVVRLSENLLDRYRERYPNLRFRQTGMAVISRDEMDAGLRDAYDNLLIAAAAIFVLLYLAFRDPPAPFFSLIALLCGVTWNLGVTALLVGRLNMITAMTGVILLGLGIDYAIHFLTGYTQAIQKGLEPHSAVVESFEKTGAGLMTGMLTTASAFYMLMISEIDILRELGLVMGNGIILTFCSSILILPALLLLRERLRNPLHAAKKIPARRSMEFAFMGRISLWACRKSRMTVFGIILATAGACVFLPGLHFITDLKKIDMKGLDSLELMDVLIDTFNLSPDPVSFMVGSPDEAEVKTDALAGLGSVGRVESIADYLPSKELQEVRRGPIRRLRGLLEAPATAAAIDRRSITRQVRMLQANLFQTGILARRWGFERLAVYCDDLLSRGEDGRGENLFSRLNSLVAEAEEGVLLELQSWISRGMKDRLHRMVETEGVSPEDLPENIRRLYVSRDGKNYLVNVYASDDIWRTFLTSPFLDDVEKIHRPVTGGPVLMKAIISAAARGGKRATVLAFLTILIFLLIDFRGIRQTFVSVIPLIAGSIWMLGFLSATGIHLTWMTVMAVPLLIGTGIDYGVHILHRYRIEGPEGWLAVMRTTGKGVLLTSLTTMIGFGSLMFSRMVGLQQFGVTLCVGIFFMLILSVILIPALLTLTGNRKDSGAG